MNTCFKPILLCAIGAVLPVWCAAAERPAAIEPRVRVIDLNIGETTKVTLCNGEQATVSLLDVKETRDEVCFAVRRAVATVEVNGQRGELVSATYHLPQLLGQVQIDCSITKGYRENGSPGFWGLDKDARLRLWPADSPLIQPNTFTYPVKQRWFASDTQMANDPVYVDGGERAGKRKIYYHSGLDLGGSEGLVEVVAATDSLVVSVGDVVLDDQRQNTPVSPRYDVVYLLDGRGWYYRYSHLQEIDKDVIPGRVIAQGDRIGLLGKEGGSGGWSHLHFEIKSRQPSGKWGTQEGYAFLWEAYRRQHKPSLIAVARPHHVIFTEGRVTLDGSRSWSASGGVASYEWICGDGTTAKTPQLERRYSKPGRYSEVLRVTDRAGNVAYDFAVVVVVDRKHPQRLIPSIHPSYYPTRGNRPGDWITFKVRSFNTAAGKEVWDFGDGTPAVVVQSDGNAVKLAADGYAVTRHRYDKPGDYVVRVTHTDEHGVTAVGHLHVRVTHAPNSASLPQPSPQLLSVRRIWSRAPHNAFTDLLRHDGTWFCVFREGSRHVSPDGSLRVITSPDGRDWSSAALISHPTDDLRDAKLSVTPDGRFMLNGAGMRADEPIRYHSMVWFSEDRGRTWSDGQRIGDPGFWLWRVHWHQGRAYSMGYRTDRDRSQRILRLYTSRDGAAYESLIDEVAVAHGVGEDRILFLKNGSALCLLRHETGSKNGLLGKSSPPFTHWTWRELNLRIGGPNMIQLPDGRVLAATRLYSPRTRTALSWIDPAQCTMTECLELPSGGDTSYPGMVLHDGVLWISYYSSHEGKASIYLAKVKP